MSATINLSGLTERKKAALVKRSHREPITLEEHDGKPFAVLRDGMVSLDMGSVIRDALSTAKGKEAPFV